MEACSEIRMGKKNEVLYMVVRSETKGAQKIHALFRNVSFSERIEAMV